MMFMMLPSPKKVAHRDLTNDSVSKVGFLILSYYLFQLNYSLFKVFYSGLHYSALLLLLSTLVYYCLIFSVYHNIYLLISFYAGLILLGTLVHRCVILSFSYLNILCYSYISAYFHGIDLTLYFIMSEINTGLLVITLLSLMVSCYYEISII